MVLESGVSQIVLSEVLHLVCSCVEIAIHSVGAGLDTDLIAGGLSGGSFVTAIRLGVYR